MAPYSLPGISVASHKGKTERDVYIGRNCNDVMKGDKMKFSRCPGKTDRNHFEINNFGGKTTGLTIPLIMALFASILFVGCGGGSSGTDTHGIAMNNAQADDMMNPGTATRTGRFIGLVSGLDYHSASADGLTDEEGRFMHADGEMMQFAVGDVILGETKAKDVVTPLDFVDEAQQSEGIANPMVTNIWRFLKSLDADADPENGITITPEIRNEVMGRMINFHQSIGDFENDPFVAALFDTLNALGWATDMSYNDRMWELCSVDATQEYMINQMGKYMPGYMERHMGTGNMDGYDYPMGEMMTDDMGSYMDDHMGTGNMDTTTGQMNDPMNAGGRHMGM